MPRRAESSTWVSLRSLRSSRILRPTSWICRVFTGAAMMTFLRVLLCQDRKILCAASGGCQWPPESRFEASAVAEALFQDLVGFGQVEALREPQLPPVRPAVVAAVAVDDPVRLGP